MSACISEPLSYMRLERYALHELPAEEDRHVAEHLERCAVCRACFERLRADGRDLELAALSAKLADAKNAPPLRAAPRWVSAVAAVAIAACALLLVLRPELRQHSVISPDLEPPTPAAPQTQSKGDALALEVVRMDTRGQLLEPTHFAEGDRFKLLLSCSEGLEGTVRVLAFQAGEVFEPVPAQDLPSCGNRRPLSGAWQLDGAGSVDLCVMFARDAQLEAVRSVEALPTPHVCAHVEPLAR